MSLFKPASKHQSRLRLALIGPSGSGKTYSSLIIGTELAAHMRMLGGTGRIAVIDTERGSASKYAGRQFAFDVLELGQCDPRNYVEAIRAAESEGYDVLIIDSLSHAWSGKGGALELVDKAAKQSKSNNTFMAWRNVTPLHNALVDTIIGSNCHIIATMRSKVDYVMEADPNTGKLTPKKVGMAPIQREGMDYEFDVVADVDLDHNLMITKTRCEKLDGEVINRPGKAFARTLIEWLSDGAPVSSTKLPESAAAATIAAQEVEAPPFMVGGLSGVLVDKIRSLVVLSGTTDQQLTGALTRRGVKAVEELSEDAARSLIAGLETVVMAAQAADLQATQQDDEPTVVVDDLIGQELVDHLVSQSNGDAADPTDDHVITDTARVEREPVKPKRKAKDTGMTTVNAAAVAEPSVA